MWFGLHPEGLLPRNVVALVEPLRKPSNEPVMRSDDSLTEAEIEQLLGAHAAAAEGVYSETRGTASPGAAGLRRGGSPDCLGAQWISMRRRPL